MAGIAEVYNFDPDVLKASIGYRLMPEYWGRGIATEVAGLLKRYMFEDADLKVITAHVMVDNIASARVLEKNGFEKAVSGALEDWGRDELVVVDKFVALAS